MQTFCIRKDIESVYIQTHFKRYVQVYNLMISHCLSNLEHIEIHFPKYPLAKNTVVFLAVCSVLYLFSSVLAAFWTILQDYEVKSFSLITCFLFFLVFLCTVVLKKQLRQPYQCPRYILNSTVLNRRCTKFLTLVSFPKKKVHLWDEEGYR